MKSTQKVIVTGEMRTGTTFMANFLNSQETGIVFSDFLIALLRNSKGLMIGDIHAQLPERTKNILVSSFIAEARSINIPISPDFCRIDGLSFGHIVEQAFKLIEDNHKATLTEFVGVKTTQAYDYLGQLLDEGYKVICMYRDPRDIVLSASNRFANFQLEEYCSVWDKNTRASLKFSTHPSFLSVHYEKLMSSPQEEIQRISEFLGSPITQNVRHGLDRFNTEFRDNSSYGDIKNMFDPSGINRWQGQRENKDVVYITVNYSKIANNLGYHFERPLKLATRVFNRLKYFKFNSKQRLKKLIHKFI